MRRIAFLSILLVYFVVSTTAQTTYYVSIDKGDDNNNGLKWSTAFKNLQTAIDAAKTGDVIFVAAGTYLPTKKIADVYQNYNPELPQNPTNDRHRSFLIRKKDLKIYGGFPKNPSDATTQDSRDWKNNTTILSGDFNGDDDDDFQNTDENALHVLVLLDTKEATVIDGFGIIGGGGTDSATVYVGGSPVEYSCGGGIYAFSDTNSSPTIQNCYIGSNKVLWYGGGFFNYSNGYANPRLTNVRISNNYADEYGGGFYNNGNNESNAILTNVEISGNQSGRFGGGAMFIGDSASCSPKFTNVVISGNKSKIAGGIYLWAVTTAETSPQFINSTICGNYSSGEGGGIVINNTEKHNTGKPSFTNTVIWGNRGSAYFNIYLGKQSKPTYSFCLIEGETLGDTNLDGSTDPKFYKHVNAMQSPTTEGDYQLSLESPLINAGTNSGINTTTDILGNQRIYDTTIDIGAYEAQGEEPSFNETMPEKSIWSYQNNLYVNINTPATLRIYTIDGKLTKHINDLGAGTYCYKLPQGCYIVTLSNGTTSKIIIR